MCLTCQISHVLTKYMYLNIPRLGTIPASKAGFLLENFMTTLIYIGKKPTKFDRMYGTGVWVQNEPRAVDSKTAEDMVANHSDIWAKFTQEFQEARIAQMQAEAKEKAAIAQREAEEAEAAVSRARAAAEQANIMAELSAAEVDESEEKGSTASTFPDEDVNIVGLHWAAAVKMVNDAPDEVVKTWYDQESNQESPRAAVMKALNARLS